MTIHSIKVDPAVFLPDACLLNVLEFVGPESFEPVVDPIVDETESEDTDPLNEALNGEPDAPPDPGAPGA